MDEATDASSSENNEGDYDVERILAQRINKGRKEYLVEWAGYRLERYEARSPSSHGFNVEIEQRGSQNQAFTITIKSMNGSVSARHDHHLTLRI